MIFENFEKIKKWPVKIRLFPEPATSSLYCLAHIWPNHKAMVKGYNSMPYATKSNKITKKEDGRLTIAATTIPISYRYKKDNKLAPIFSHIHFSAEYLQEIFLTHELLHALINWQIRAKLNPAFMFSKQVTDDEERFCYAHGSMMWQLISRLEKLGLKDGN